MFVLIDAKSRSFDCALRAPLRMTTLMELVAGGIFQWAISMSQISSSNPPNSGWSFSRSL